MKLRSRQHSRGSVALMTLSLLAALAIGLAGYLAVAKQAMTLSNRNYQGTVSRQLAEMGLERALWSINRNDWSNWTLNGTTATRTISFANSKYGAIGTTGTIKLRIDNYNALVKDAAWSSSESYSAGDIVGYSGIWYRCVSPHANKTPSATSTYWVNDKSTLTNTWVLDVDYTVGDMAYDNGNWYSCTQDHTSSASILTSDTDYWKNIPYITQNPTLYYSTDSLVNWYGTWYRWTGSSWQSNPPISWVWTSSTSYVVGDVVCYSKVWYTCILAHSNKTPSSNPTYWKSAATSASDAGANVAWIPNTNYSLGDVVYRSGSWYRCILAHNSGGSFSTTNWSTSPRQTLNWVQNKTYATNSVVFHQGTWYRNTSSTSNVPPASPWRTAASYAPWNSTSYYSSGSYVSYGNVWYKCIAGHSGQSPNNSTYWQAQGAPVIYAEGQAAIPNGDTIKTQLRAVVAKAPLFPNAAAAQTLTFGTGATVDSYDAGTTPTSTTYSSQVGTNTNDQAVLAGSNPSGTAVAINTATVKGFLAAPSSGTSPYSPLVSYANSASVTNYAGAVSVPAGSATNVDLARISRSPYIPLFEIPNIPLFATPSVQIGEEFIDDDTSKTLGTPGAVTPSVFYCDTGIVLRNLNETITIDGPVILDVNGQFRTRRDNTARLVITPTGSLLLRVKTNFRIDSPSGGIQNQTFDPKKCTVVIADGDTGTFNYNSTTDYYGVIYMPNATSTFTVGNNIDIFGAIYAKTLTFGSNAQLHYDTSLRTHEIPGADAPCVITDWRELTVTTERASL